MLTDHLNHKGQVQGLTAVSICILTQLVAETGFQDKTTATLKDFIV